MIYQKEMFKVRMPIGLLVSEARAPGRYNADISAEFDNRDYGWKVELQMGYVSYFNKDWEMSNILSSGVRWGLLVGKMVSEKIGLSVWVLGNHYGFPIERHFGMAVSFGGVGMKLNELTAL
jgi:hypothetical protein